MLFSAKQIIAASGMSKTDFYRALNIAIEKKLFEKTSTTKRYDTLDAMRIANALGFEDRWEKYYEACINQAVNLAVKSPKQSQTVPNSSK